MSFSLHFQNLDSFPRTTYILCFEDMHLGSEDSKQFFRTM